MDILLVTNPITFINSLSIGGAYFVIFCATTLGTITVFWALSYLLFRPLSYHDAFAPLENLSQRFFTVTLLVLSTAGAYFASVLLKNYFKIGRPVLLNFNFHPLINNLNDYGFPSSHAAFYSALATTLFLIHRRAGVYAGLLALVIGAARILAGVHTPLDILGGYLLGTGIAAIVSFTAQAVSKTARKK